MTHDEDSPEDRAIFERAYDILKKKRDETAWDDAVHSAIDALDVKSHDHKKVLMICSAIMAVVLEIPKEEMHSHSQYGYDLFEVISSFSFTALCRVQDDASLSDELMTEHTPAWVYGPFNQQTTSDS